MKKHVNLKDVKFSDKEYSALREEINYRLKIVYNHGFTLASVILVFFSATLVFVGKVIEIAVDKNFVFINSFALDLFIILAISIFAAFPVLLVYCYSVKYEDNLRQICNFSAYQKVYYEYPSMLRKSESDNTILGWELLQCNNQKNNTSKIGSEYVAISIMSLVLSTILFIALCIYFCLRQSGDLFSSEKVIESTITLFAFIALFVGAIAIFIKLTINITQKTKSEKIFKYYNQVYLKEYLDLAVEIGFFSKEEANELIDFQSKLINIKNNSYENFVSKKKARK